MVVLLPVYVTLKISQMHHFHSLFQNTSGSRCFLCFFCFSEGIYRVFCPIGSGWQQTSAWIDGLLPSCLSLSLLTGAFFLSDASWSPPPHGACGDFHIKLTQSIKAVHTLAGGRIPPVASAYFLHNMQATLVTEGRCSVRFDQKNMKNVLPEALADVFIQLLLSLLVVSLPVVMISIWF